MKHRIYRTLVPKSIQGKLYQMYLQQYEHEQYLKRKECENSLPVFELSSGYIKNLRVVTDMDELFNLMPKNAAVAEVGSGDGQIAYKILAITKPKKLYLLDTWSDSTPQAIGRGVIENKFKAEINSGQVEIRQGAPVSELSDFDEACLDWVFLNTDSTYENTASTLKVCQEKVKAGGIIAGTNYAIGDWLSAERFGVIEAVNEFCKVQGWEMVTLTNERDRRLNYALKEISSYSRLDK